MPAPRERMLRLLSLLQSGRRWPAGELATAMETTGRTLRRDIEHLREMGYPVQSVRGPGGHYQLVAGQALPPLMLEDDEAIATILGLKLAAADSTGTDVTTEAAQRAVSKLRRILPARLTRRTDQVLAAVEVGGADYPQPAPEQVGSLAEAISTHRCLTFTHTGKRGTRHRTVEPVRLVRMSRRWYLFAWDRDREDWRTFRLDRITDTAVTTSTFAPRRAPAEDLVGYLQDHFHGSDTLHRVVLILHTSAPDAASRLYRIDGVLEPLTENRCRYIAHVDSYEWLTLVLVLTGIEFTIEEPDDFRDHVSAAARRLLRATATD
ncbi:helix-turn-helix transcriptional regulator [Streptomyces celluloflavus]|uniref:Helix-turn-helix transcriptional regulator n=1 Tax=Streptomyces celluloflavus TaxID=58344 RepID=A0ABW7RPK2_9ACTN